MTISDQIRGLAHGGMSVSDIAKRLGIRYQHAYKVCKDAKIANNRSSLPIDVKNDVRSKPDLSVDTILRGGFVHAGKWKHGDIRLQCPPGVPQEAGVYAFSISGQVVYVGLASRSLAQRLYFYGNPGVSQRTNVRVNALIRAAFGNDCDVEIYVASPPTLDWNGFKISGPEGLEAGIIQDFYLPWNVRGA